MRGSISIGCADREADARAKPAARLLRETARHLAVRMSFEDVIRVAAGQDRRRRASRRIAAEIGAKRASRSRITEFLKPGIEELCSVLPPRLARAILAYCGAARLARHASIAAWRSRPRSVSGYLRFWLLAKLRRLRPNSYRFAEEQRAIEAWLAR